MNRPDYWHENQKDASDCAGEFPEVGKPNIAPIPGNVDWYNPRVEAALEELHESAAAFAEERVKLTARSSFNEFNNACNRLENAALAFGDVVREYTGK